MLVCCNTTKHLNIVCDFFHSEIQVGTLTPSKMRQILDTGVGWVSTTYLIWQNPATGALLTFQSGGGQHAEVNFMNYLTSNGIAPGTVTHFWLSNSPCHNCANELIHFFAGGGPATQTIYVGNIYKGGSSIAIQQQNREGLEQLFLYQFNLQNWIWLDFYNLLGNINFDPNVRAILYDYLQQNPPYNDPAYQTRDNQVVTCLYEVNHACYKNCKFGNTNAYQPC